MHIESFTSEEQSALRDCVASLRALPIYHTQDFETVFGYSKEEVEAVYEAFPDWDLYDESKSIQDLSGDVLRNAFAWLLNGKEEERRAMYARLSFDVTRLPHLYEKLGT